MKKTLILIPARAGSKGLPGKNTMILGDIPLISHTLRFAQCVRKDDDIICVSSNDDEVLSIASQFQDVDVPFKRPEELATDEAGSNDVILHALKHYSDLGVEFENVLLLQPTSPFRILEDYEKIATAYKSDLDMVVSVTSSKNNPYFNLFEEGENGFLHKSKEFDTKRRQDCPEVYAFNGSFYLMNVESLRTKGIRGFKKIVKSVMPEERSIDIDNMRDWKIAEYLLKEKINENS